MPTQTGKRYVCGTCGSEMLVTKAGEGSLMCCGQPMQMRGAPAPTSGAANASQGGNRG
ncbi:MAG TPA: hypothetical protein VFC51_01120 [Chloroflexota bacterium]|nr:hypothetical protein [Chloroflexota bacterium]